MFLPVFKSLLTSFNRASDAPCTYSQWDNAPERDLHLTGEEEAVKNLKWEIWDTKWRSSIKLKGRNKRLRIPKRMKTYQTVYFCIDWRQKTYI